MAFLNLIFGRLSEGCAIVHLPVIVHCNNKLQHALTAYLALCSAYSQSFTCFCLCQAKITMLSLVSVDKLNLQCDTCVCPHAGRYLCVCPQAELTMLSLICVQRLNSLCFHFCVAKLNLQCFTLFESTNQIHNAFYTVGSGSNLVLRAHRFDPWV